MAYWILKVVFTPFMHIAFRVRAKGTKNVPRRGPVILASNHQSFIDSIFMSLVVHRRLTFVAKEEYFENRKIAWFFRAMGMIPIKREGGTASQRAMIAAQEVLACGGMLGIYPEGTRSPDGRLYKGHTGAARLALLCNAASGAGRSVRYGRRAAHRRQVPETVPGGHGGDGATAAV